MNPIVWGAMVAVGVFFATLVCLEVGYRFAHRRSQRSDLSHEGVGAMEAAVFALLGLLLGFSFALTHRALTPGVN
jgi:hypothetical protein